MAGGRIVETHMCVGIVETHMCVGIVETLVCVGLCDIMRRLSEPAFCDLGLHG